MTLETFKSAARPFSIYVSALTVAAGIFTPWVGVDKLWIALALGGGVAAMRSIDKRSPAA